MKKNKEVFLNILQLTRISTDQIIEIVERSLCATVANIEQLEGKGFENLVYILTTSEGKFVFRTNPNEGNVSRFQKEQWSMQEANKVGVLAPEVSDIGLENNQPYMIMPFIEGTRGADSPKKDFLWTKIGEYACKIHAIKPEGFGGEMVSPGVFEGNWKKYIDYNLQCLTSDDVLIKSEYITKEQSKLLKDVFSELINIKFNFGLTHYDLSLGNTIITDRDEVYLLDWGSAGSRVVPHTDFAEILDEQTEDDSDIFKLILKGYGMTISDYKKVKEELKKLYLLNATDNLRYCIDRKPEKIEYATRYLHSKLSSYKKTID